MLEEADLAAYRRGQPRRGSRQLAPRPSPPAPMRLPQSRDRAGSRDRETTVQGPLRIGAPVGIEKELGADVRGSRLAEVEGERLPVGTADQQEPPTGEVPRFGEGDGEGERGRDRGIDRVSAAKQDVPPDPAREGVRADDDPMRGASRWGRRREDGDNEDRNRDSACDPRAAHQGQAPLNRSVPSLRKPTVP